MKTVLLVVGLALAAAWVLFCVYFFVLMVLYALAQIGKGAEWVLARIFAAQNRLTGERG